jgi:hypothetical protein
MAAKKKSMGPTSQGTTEAKKALAGMEKGHKILQLNLKKLERIVSGHFHAGTGGHFGGITGGHFGGITGGHFGGRAGSSKKKAH